MHYTAIYERIYLFLTLGQHKIVIVIPLENVDILIPRLQLRKGIYFVDWGIWSEFQINTSFSIS